MIMGFWLPKTLFSGRSVQLEDGDAEGTREAAGTSGTLGRLLEAGTLFNAHFFVKTLRIWVVG